MIQPVLLPRTDYKRPESVLVIVYTRSGETLLLQRAGNPFWQSVTGSLNWDERDPADAARRELLEETGIAASDGWRDWKQSRRFMILPEYRYRYGPGVIDNEEHVFSLELPGRCEVRLDPQEHVQSQWEKIETAAKSLWSWTNRAALSQLAEELV